MIFDFYFLHFVISRHRMDISDDATLLFRVKGRLRYTVRRYDDECGCMLLHAHDNGIASEASILSHSLSYKKNIK